MAGAGTGCTQVSITTGDEGITTTRFGDANQNAVVLTLFEETSFGGTATEVTASGRTFDSPTTFRSYYFTGPNSWAYSSSSSSACLQHTLVGDFGITYSAVTTLSNVVSIELGCGSIDPTRPTEPPQSTTTTSNPTTGSTTTPDPDLFSCVGKPDGIVL